MLISHGRQRCNETVQLPSEVWPSLCFVDVPHNLRIFYAVIYASVKKNLRVFYALTYARLLVRWTVPPGSPFNNRLCLWCPAVLNPGKNLTAGSHKLTKKSSKIVPLGAPLP